MRILRAIIACALANLRLSACQYMIPCCGQVCRLFGAPWLAGRIVVSDLRVIPESWPGTFAVRRGATLSRDRDVMIEGSLYRREAVPTGTRF
ncbi:MAG TPA: hypothetical protein VKQ72_15220, partial [Aggregatilineales bacterium]|nr:hypothetical protein [Aggregatilineales bacterium]